MDFRRTSLVLYILFIFHLQENLLFVNSRPLSVETNHESLPGNPSETDDIVGFEGKTRELTVVIKRASGVGRGGGSGSRGGRGGGSGSRGGRGGGIGSRGGRGGGSGSRGGRGGGSGSRGGRGGGRSQLHGGAGVIHPARSPIHRSSGSMNLRGAVCAVGWLCFSVLAGLFLI